MVLSYILVGCPGQKSLRKLTRPSGSFLRVSKMTLPLSWATIRLAVLFLKKHSLI